MRYISVDFRLNIMDAYRTLHNLRLSDQELDPILFGDPTMRKAVDEACDLADKEVDRERFFQASEEWFDFVASKLPMPAKPDVVVEKGIYNEAAKELKELADDVLTAEVQFFKKLIEIVNNAEI